MPVEATTDWTALRYLGVGLIVAVPLVTLAWAAAFPESPFYQLMQAHPRLRGFVEGITAPALLFAVVGSGGGHGGGGDAFLFGVFLEGVTLGVFLAFAAPWLVRRFKTGWE